MVWTKIFKSKSAKLKADPKIRWFGKLPTYQDYYRSRGDEAWAVEFNEWIIKGFEYYQARHESSDGFVANDSPRVPRIAPSAVIVRLPKSSMTVLSYVMDFGGDMRGRPFPICLYVGLPTSCWPGPTSDHVMPAARAIGQLMRLGRDIPRFIKTPSRFETMVGERKVELGGMEVNEKDETWIDEARALPMEEWFAAAAQGLLVKDLATWQRLAHRWGDHIARHDGRHFRPTLRFPLARSITHEVQVAGWIRWLEQRMSMKHRTLSLLLAGENERRPGRLAVIARDLVAEDFLLLTERWSALAYVDNLTEVDVEDHEPPRSGPEEEETRDEGGPGSPAGSWHDFVQTPPSGT